MLARLLAATVVFHASAHAQAAAPLDTMLDVGGYRLHFVIHRGTLPVTVVMESGGAATISRWKGVDQTIAQRSGATVVTYERAGFGRSELGPSELMPATQVADLGKALERLAVPARRIIVGHSYGGLMAVAHASAYSEHVAGVVLVDPMNARFVDATGDFVFSTVPHIAEPKTDVERAISRLVRTFPDIASIARVAEPKLRMPVVVITGTRSMWNNREAEDRAWRDSHAAIASAAPGRRLVVAEGSGHDVPSDRPDTIVEAVLSLMPPPTR